MIHWFPGHMAKAMRELEASARLADLLIIVLDARAPLSTYNPKFEAVVPTTPRLFVLTKVDLADASKLPALKQKLLGNLPRRAVISVNLKQPASAKKQITSAALKLLHDYHARETKRGIIKPRARMFVIGIPNAGKSSLINVLAGSAKTKVANRPGVTRGRQWIKAGDFDLLDTPGILWPETSTPLVGVRLALIGSLRRELINQRALFEEGYFLLSAFYPHLLKKIGLSSGVNEHDAANALLSLAERLNFKAAGGVFDTNKAMQYFNKWVNDLKGVTYD